MNQGSLSKLMIVSVVCGTWNDRKQKQIDIALRRAKDFVGEVWLDDVKIR